MMNVDKNEQKRYKTRLIKQWTILTNTEINNLALNEKN